MNERFMGEAMLTTKVFDETFQPIAYLADEQGRLGSIELLIQRNGISYVLDIEAYPVHVEREMSEEDSSNTDDDPTYVIAAEEILPSDLMTIKAKPTEELERYLVLQEG